MAMKYIKPETKTYKIELQQIMAGSPGPDAVAGGGTDDQNDLLSRGFFFEEEEDEE